MFTREKSGVCVWRERRGKSEEGGRERVKSGVLTAALVSIYLPGKDEERGRSSRHLQQLELAWSIKFIYMIHLVYSHDTLL
jgi:hypothetical protein